MTREEVVGLMQTSRNENEWNENCDTVKKKCGGYPSFWFEAIMLSGIANKVRNSWISTAVKGNLSEIMPEGNPNPNVKVMELLPPDEAEIAAIKAERKKSNG